jgi:hypothetical protein
MQAAASTAAAQASEQRAHLGASALLLQPLREVERPPLVLRLGLARLLPLPPLLACALLLRPRQFCQRLVQRRVDGGLAGWRLRLCPCLRLLVHGPWEERRGGLGGVGSVQLASRAQWRWQPLAAGRCRLGS